MTLATSLVVLFNCYATVDILTNFYSNASCFSLLMLYLGNSYVRVYRTIGPTLVSFCYGNLFPPYIYSSDLYAQASSKFGFIQHLNQ